LKVFLYTEDMEKHTQASAKKNKSEAPAPFYRTGKFQRLIGGLLLIIFGTLLAFRLSPWPGALIIRAVFDDNGAKMKQTMERYTPSKSITVLSNQQYRANDKDALLDVYYPSEAAKGNKKFPVIIWTHGGAWISGGKEDAAPYFKLLAAKGFTVVVPEYTLAPRQHYPYQIHQLNDAHAYITKEARRFHADTGRIFLAGDSAGAQLSAQLATLITNAPYAKEANFSPALKPAQLKGVILNCGIYKMQDLAHPAPQLPKLLGWGDDVTVWAYSGTHDFSRPVIKQMSPYYHVTKDFPPAYVTGGNADPLTAVQSKPFVNELQAKGVDVDMLFFPDDYKPALPHEYQFNLATEAARTAFIKTVSFVKKASEQ
jgi:acetyl esterase